MTIHLRLGRRALCLALLGGLALTPWAQAHPLPSSERSERGAGDEQAPPSARGNQTHKASHIKILSQPLSQTKVLGEPAVFTVVAEGKPRRLHYQWWKDGRRVGQDAPNYLIPATEAQHAGAYAVTVRNPTGSVTSDPAVLTVNFPPTITLQPVSQTVDQGMGVTFTVAAGAEGGAALGYQWRKDGAPIPGATAATFSLAATAAADAGSYEAVVSSLLNGTVASITSLPAILKVNLPPTILVQPKTQTVRPPDAVTFTVTARANNGGSLAYAWKKNGALLDGATSASYTVPSTEFALNADTYSVSVSEGNLGTESGPVQALASVPAPTYAGDPIPVPSRPLTVLPSLHVDPVQFPNGAFRLGYDETLKNPVWTAYVNFPVKSPYPNSTADYKADGRLEAPQVGKDDYTGIYTGGAGFPDSYDRGHQVPRADVSYRYTPVAGDDATIMSNLVPQISQFNQQTWQKLEDAIGGTQGGATNGLTSFKGRVWVYTGSVFPVTPTWWNSKVTPGLRIAIPEACYKIVLHEKTPGHPEVLALLLPNTWGLANSTATLTGYVTSVARIESLTGLNFFPQLAAVAPDLDIPTWKATVDVRGWKVPFEQATGPNVHMIQPSYDTTVEVGSTVIFEGAATPGASAGTAIAAASWTFGDASPSSTGFSTAHQYASAGSFQATFTASDDLGTSNTLTRVIRVIPPASSNEAPTTAPAVLENQAATTGQALTVAFTVVDDRTLAGLVKVAAVSDNATLLPTSGIQTTNASGAVTLRLAPAAGQEGTATVTVTLTDGDGATSTRTFLLTVKAAATNTLVETFEAGTKTAYAAANVTFASGVWTLADALVGTSASDPKSDLKSIRVRNGVVTMAFDWPKGAQTVSVNHAKYGTDANSTWELYYSVDSGSTWTLAGPAVTSSTTALSPAVFALNQPGPIRFEFRKVGGTTTRFNLDDFRIQGY
ncbi:hypothetical protein GETHOR_22670 [Geothrix oryzae]|uniref:PKD domain-containing protein n=1 Tax=Geothrix oryzae TaxID=2927975 RepID=A0ABM8DT21_9BACT|nr:DNA/RNA non-specific endonuclease [Geothrix oryzae]BDU70166.1 hypothetical protein GETHOR_22670 [Geothrix oryzae]